MDRLRSQCTAASRGHRLGGCVVYALGGRGAEVGCGAGFQAGSGTGSAVVTGTRSHAGTVASTARQREPPKSPWALSLEQALSAASALAPAPATIQTLFVCNRTYEMRACARRHFDAAQDPLRIQATA
eukprot:5867514-Pleurochrysis_carterae.AAC.2